MTLRDGLGVTSSIGTGAYGGGFEEPYKRSGGWHNEMETVRIRLSDFLNNGSALNLADVRAVRLEFGPGFGSPQGRIVLDEVMLTTTLAARASDCRAAHALRLSGTSRRGAGCWFG